MLIFNLDTIVDILQYSNKLDDKFVKNPKISELINDSQTIYIVLQENMEKNNLNFLECIKKDLENNS